MGSHPVNLVIRFLLEISALVGMGVWGLQQSESAWRYILAFGIPVLAAAAWGIFAVPDDPSRSGTAPVAVPGILRLMIELAIFAFAVWAFLDSGYPVIGIVLGIIAGFHYIISYDRIVWLIKQK